MLYKPLVLGPPVGTTFLFMSYYGAMLHWGLVKLVQPKRLLELQAHESREHAQLSAGGLVLSHHSPVALPPLELLPVLLQTRSLPLQKKLDSYH